MREREPKDQTFAKGTFGRFVKRHGITRDITPVDPDRFIEGPWVKRTNVFVVSLEKADKTYTSSIQFDRIFEFLPEVEDVLEHIANDIATFRHFSRDMRGFALLMGMAPDDPRLQAHFEDIASRDAAFRVFLGEEAYQEFVKISEVRGPVPPDLET